MAEARRHTHVLVVESDAVEVNRIASHLDGMFIWDVATSLKEAERKIQQSRPRVILLAEEMSGQPTLDFCRRLKSGPSRREQLVVSLVKGDPRLARMAEAQNSGIDLHLHKPVGAKDLHDCLRLSWQILKKGDVAEVSLDGVPSPVSNSSASAEITASFPPSPRASSSASPAAPSPASTPSKPGASTPPSRLKELLSMEIDTSTLKNLFRR